MDKVRITILDDGTIKVDTDKVSMPNHMNAEQFLRNMFTLAGGAVTRTIKHGLAHAGVRQTTAATDTQHQ